MFRLNRNIALSVSAIFTVAFLGTAGAQIPADNQRNEAAKVIPDTPSETRRIVIEPVPETQNGFLRKTASETPSGFQVPRYVSLKFGKVNARTGPSRDHSIAWQYRRRGLPLIVVAETEMWRKVRDVNGDEGWVLKSALSGERFVMTVGETVIHNKPKDTAKTVAISEAGALLELESCNSDGWCKVKAGNGLRGWTPRETLWGAKTL